MRLTYLCYRLDDLAALTLGYWQWDNLPVSFGENGKLFFRNFYQLDGRHIRCEISKKNEDVITRNFYWIEGKELRPFTEQELSEYN